MTKRFGSFTGMTSREVRDDDDFVLVGMGWTWRAVNDDGVVLAEPLSVAGVFEDDPEPSV